MKKYRAIMPLYEIRLSVIGACNQRCVYCGPFVDGKYTRGYGQLTLDQFKEFVSKLGDTINSNRLHIQLTGGEPTLRKDLVEIVSILSEKVTDIGITTNGSLITPQLVKDLIGNGLSDFHIHLPSLDRTAYEKTCGVQVSEERIKNITESALLIQKLGKRVEFNTPVTNLNINTLPELLEFCYINKVNLKLIEELRLDGTPQIGINEIKKLLSDWITRNNIATDQTKIKNRFGIIYQFEKDFFFRIAPVDEEFKNSLSGNAKKILLDGRYWLGAFHDKFLYTSSYSITPKAGTISDVVKDINKVIAEYSRLDNK